MSSMSESYSWKSSAAPDPQSAQRSMARQQQRNQRHAAELSALRNARAGDGPSLPAYLRRKPAASSESAASQQTGAKYM